MLEYIGHILLIETKKHEMIYINIYIGYICIYIYIIEREDTTSKAYKNSVSIVSNVIMKNISCQARLQTQGNSG